MFSKSKYKYGKVKMDFVLPFGKYRFMTIKEVYNYDSQYLGWAQVQKIFKLPGHISKECEKAYKRSSAMRIIRPRVYADDLWMENDEWYGGFGLDPWDCF